MAREGRRAVNEALRHFWVAAQELEPDNAEDVLVQIILMGIPPGRIETWVRGLPRWVVRILRVRWERARLLNRPAKQGTRRSVRESAESWTR